MTQRHYGRKPHTPDERDWTWGSLRESVTAAGALAVPLVPARFGHGNTYEGQGWMMNGNGPVLPGEDLPPTWAAAAGGAGDCVEASWVNEVKEALTDAGMSPVEALKKVGSAKTSITAYSAVTPYDPVTGANDNGTEIRERLKYAQKTGLTLADSTVHKIGPYFSVDPKNLQHWLEAMYFAEALPLGIIVQQAQQDAFNEGEQTGRFPIVWDWVAGSPEVGRHCIPAVGRPDTLHIAALTWARRIFLTEAFRQNGVEEAWAYVTQDRISKVTGRTYEGADQAHTIEYLRTVAKAES
jgi:hypothetical protein